MRTIARRKRALLGLLLALPVLLSGTTGTSVLRDGRVAWGEPVPQTCESDLAIIGARGSGEGLDRGSIVGFGRRLSPTVESLVGDVHAQVRVTFLAVPYPAAPGWTPLFDLVTKEYGRSVEIGASMVANKVHHILAQCESTGIVLAGYSQGAEVMQRAVQSLTRAERDRLVGLVLVANPVAHASEGQAGGIRAGHAQDLPPDLTRRVLEICDPGDEICAADRVGLRSGIETHKTAYAKADAWTDEIQAFVRTRLFGYTQSPHAVTPLGVARYGASPVASAQLWWRSAAGLDPHRLSGQASSAKARPDSRDILAAPSSLF